MRLIDYFGHRLDPFWIVFLIVLIARPVKVQACDTNTCKPSEHKRCYPTQLLTEATEIPTCRCLKGLYQLNDACIGVIRYDFTIQLQIAPAFVNQRLSEERIKALIQQIPSVMPADSPISSRKQISMDVELVHFRAAPNQESIMFMHNKIVAWKTNAANINDLPQIELKQANQELEKYFKETISYDPTANKTWWMSLLIGDGDLRSKFQSTWTLSYNQWTCETYRYNYCDLSWAECEPFKGSVRCKCLRNSSVDISPEIEFPGETCKNECSANFCKNGGECFYQDGQPTCYCINNYVGDYCQIDLILFIIIDGIVIVTLLASICCCGCLFALNKRRRRKEKKETQNQSQPGPPFHLRTQF